MPTPTPAQASSHYWRLQQIATAAAVAVRPLFAAKRPLPNVTTLVAAYQRAAVTTATRTVAGWAQGSVLTRPEAFAGVSSQGFPLIEPIIATIDRQVPAPPEAIPAPWWDDAADFMREVELLIASEVADAARTATQTEMIGHGWTEYVRVLNPPSCPRCTILAGRVYRWSTGFQRHPGCDCQMVPVDSATAANDLLTKPCAAFDAGQVRGLSKADAQAIADGADMDKVVNATRGLGAPGVTAAGVTELFGRRVKYTTEATTKRAAWRKKNPSRLVRLRPESIYRDAKSPEDAIRLLKLYGYF